MVARVMAQLAFGPTLPERQLEAYSRLLARSGLAFFRLRNNPLDDDIAPFFHAMVREGNHPVDLGHAAIRFYLLRMPEQNISLAVRVQLA